MQDNVYRILKKEINHHKGHKVFLCIGENSCIGDSLGPCVGELLSNRIKDNHVSVIGNIQRNVNSKNFDYICNQIEKKKKHPYFIMIDAALSNKDLIGNIIIHKNKMLIGKALGNNKIPMGNLSIKGIVGEDLKNPIKNFYNLNLVPDNIIESLAKEIVNQIVRALEV